MAASSRPAGRDDSRRRRQAPAERSSGTASTGLTTRAAVLGLVVVGLLISAALPARQLLTQRGDLAEAEVARSAAQERVSGLEQELTRLDDPTYVAGLARSRLHFVLPGETTYQVINPEKAPATPEPSGATARSDVPWYTQLWDTTTVADEPPAPASGPR